MFLTSKIIFLNTLLFQDCLLDLHVTYKHTWHCEVGTTALGCPWRQLTKAHTFILLWVLFVCMSCLFFLLVLVSGDRLSLMPRLASFTFGQSPASDSWVLEMLRLHACTLHQSCFDSCVGGRQALPRSPLYIQGSKAQKKAESRAGTTQHHNTRFFNRNEGFLKKEKTTSGERGYAEGWAVETQLMTESSIWR